MSEAVKQWLSRTISLFQRQLVRDFVRKWVSQWRELVKSITLTYDLLLVLTVLH